MSNNSNRRPEGSSNNTAHEQANALLKEGIRNKIPSSKIAELRRKYNDDEMIDRIQEVFYDRLNEIRSKSKKFVKAIEKKFASKGLPLHIVLKESKKYKQKYGLSDIEFNEFKKQYEKLMNARLPINEQQNLVPNTNMAQLFGDVNAVDGLTVRDSDYPVIQDIIKMYQVTRGTHSSVILQSMQYNECDTEVMQAKYDVTRNNLAFAVNPILVAMFAPKINIFEQHFLYTNIAYIVKCKYGREPINNAADLDLLHHMIIDSQDIVCSADSPLKDIRLRCNVQNNLWNNVLAMRAGKFFDSIGNDFFSAIDECKISMYDAPDLIYAGDEGVILKRLLAAMSFNPLIVSTDPVFGVNGNSNPINFPVIMNRVVARPLLTLRLPERNAAHEPITLESAVTNSQVYIENGMFVPKTQQVVYSRGVIIFHVPRRTVAAIDNYSHLISPTPKFTQIPSHILINERINDVPIEFQHIIEIAKQPYTFASAIVLETPNIDANDDDREQRDKIVIGTATIIRDTSKGNGALFEAPYKIYSPKMIVLQSIVAPVAGAGVNDIKDVWHELKHEDNAESILRIKGTVFIFRSPE